MKKVFVFIVFWLVQPIMVLAQQWESILPDSVSISSGFINGDNTIELVGCAGNEGAYVKVFDDGQYEITTFPTQEGKRLILQTTIPLNGIGYFVSGRIQFLDDDYLGEQKILILDNNLGVVNEQIIHVAEEFIGFNFESDAIMDDDGTIVFLACARRERPNIPGSYEFRGVFFRFSQQGECLSCRYLIADAPAPIYYMQSIKFPKLLNDPYSDQIIAVCGGRNGLQSLLYFDYDFNLTADFFIDDMSFSEVGAGWQCKYVEDPYTNYWYNTSEMLLLATQRDTILDINHPHVLIGKMNREGEIFEKIEINKQDSLMYACRMTCANDSTIYIMAKCNTDNWLTPYYPQIYLINKDLEILGCLSLWNHLNYSPILAFATQDEGCTVIVSRSIVFSETPLPCAIHFSREDFHPVWSIKEKPKQEILSSVYPNPATEEIHIDLTNIPTNGSVHLRIANMMGQTFIDRIIRGTGNLLTVGVVALPAGTYSYCLYNKDEIIVKGKFVKL